MPKGIPTPKTTTSDIGAGRKIQLIPSAADYEALEQFASALQAAYLLARALCARPAWPPPVISHAERIADTGASQENQRREPLNTTADH